MAERPTGESGDDRPLGLAEYLDEEVEWRALMGRVHRSIARRDAAGQAVEFTAHGVTGVVVEYLCAAVEAWGRGRGGRSGD